MPFETPLRVEYVDGTTACLLEDLVYRGKDDVIIVPKGYETDFASVPWWVQSILPRTGKWTKAAVIHDVLCTELNIWRRDSELVDRGIISAIDFAQAHPGGEPIHAIDTDGIFRRIMREQGVGFCRRWMMWMGVRWGAAGNRARRGGWWSTFPALLAVSVVTLATLVLGVSAVHALIDWLAPWM